MIKNIIFDVDNTIFDSSEKNAIYYKKALEKLGYNPERYMELYKAMDKYEERFTDENNLYNKQDMLDLINKELNENYDIKLIDEINDVIGRYWIDDIFLKEDVLKYLNDKYNLYIFSNWFYDAPYKRLETVGYLKYFKAIYTSDRIGSKPYKSSYINLLENINASANECIMIGDSLRSDILGATSVGIKAIWFNQFGKKDEIIKDKSKYYEIKDFIELKQIL